MVWLPSVGTWPGPYTHTQTHTHCDHLCSYRWYSPIRDSCSQWFTEAELLTPGTCWGSVSLLRHMTWGSQDLKTTNPAIARPLTKPLALKWFSLQDDACLEVSVRLHQLYIVIMQTQQRSPGMIWLPMNKPFVIVIKWYCAFLPEICTQSAATHLHTLVEPEVQCMGDESNHRSYNWWGSTLPLNPNWWWKTICSREQHVKKP